VLVKESDIIEVLLDCDASYVDDGDDDVVQHLSSKCSTFKVSRGRKKKRKGRRENKTRKMAH
jgi:hypothetical protein